MLVSRFGWTMPLQASALPRIDGLRFAGSLVTGDLQVAGRNQVPTRVDSQEELDALKHLHLGGSDDPLLNCVRDLAEHGFQALELRGASPGAPVDRVALYRYTSGLSHRGCVQVAMPGSRRGISAHHPETLRALAFFHASGQDYGLMRPGLARGLQALEKAGFQLHTDGVPSHTLETAPALVSAYTHCVIQRKDTLWLSRDGGPRIPVSSRLAERPSEAAARVASVDLSLVPPCLGTRERADFLEMAMERSMPRLARLVTRREELASAPALLDQLDRQAFEVEAFAELSATVGRALAVEAIPLVSVAIEGESDLERARLFAEVAGAGTETDRRVDYVRLAVERFGSSDPEAARQKLGMKLLWEKAPRDVRPPAAIGENSQGNLVVGGVVVRSKRP